MTNDIRAKAEALVNIIEKYKAEPSLSVHTTREFKDLKAALRPSPKEIADVLSNLDLKLVRMSDEKEHFQKYVNLAIEELKK